MMNTHQTLKIPKAFFRKRDFDLLMTFSVHEADLASSSSVLSLVDVLDLPGGGNREEADVNFGLLLFSCKGLQAVRERERDSCGQRGQASTAVPQPDLGEAA